MKTYQINELNSGMWRSDKSLYAVGDVVNQLALVEAGGKEWIAKGKLNGRQLAKGQFVLASYNSSNQGADVYEILGLTDNDTKYGEGGVKFDSVKEIMAAKNVKTLTALEDLPSDEYGQDIYLVVRDVHTNESGPWFYLFEGRWSRGSGAEALSFTEVKEFDAAEYEAERQAEEQARRRVHLENRQHQLQVQMAELQRQLQEVEAQLA